MNKETEEEKHMRLQLREHLSLVIIPDPEHPFWEKANRRILALTYNGHIVDYITKEQMQEWLNER